MGEQDDAESFFLPARLAGDLDSETVRKCPCSENQNHDEIMKVHALLHRLRLTKRDLCTAWATIGVLRTWFTKIYDPVKAVLST